MKRAIACSKQGDALVRIDAGGLLLSADAAPGQFDLLLASLAACTALTLRDFAAARKWPLATLDVYLTLDHGAGGLCIERRLLLTGLDAAQQAILLNLAGVTPLTLVLAPCMRIATVLL